MRNRKFLSNSINLALVGGAIVTSLGVSFVSAEEAVDSVERIQVTGSRIQRTNVVTSSPVMTLSAADIKASGVTRIEDLLNDMPQVFAAQNSTVSNGSSGTATVDLRGLGSQRTLVLVNGRRLPAGSILGSTTADLNTIPANMVERVEVLTGGSSATYGSDAIGGVVNFILKKDFEGFQFDYQYSLYQHDNSDKSVQDITTASGFDAPNGNVTDGNANDFSIMMGTNFSGDKGNITAYATVRDIDAVVQSDRDYSACALTDDGAGGMECGGSSTIPTGRFTDFADFDYTVSGNQFIPRDGLLYNYGPTNYFQRPDNRRTFGVIGNYSLNDNVEIYTELSMMDDRTVAQIAPSGNFFTTSTLGCGNPLLSDQQFDAICGQYGLTKDDTRELYIGRRNIEGGPRQDDLRHTMYRGVLGIRGEINDDWTYDVYGNYGTTAYIQTYRNDMSNARIARSLDVVTDPDTGSAVCQSVLDGSDASCVPWNIFEAGGVTQEALDYLILPLYARGDTESLQLNGFVSGDLTDNGWVLPTATTGLGVVFGIEHREESMTFEPDSGFQSGDGAGQGGATTGLDGSYTVNDLYAELELPLLEDKFLAQDLVLEAAYRYSDYSTDNTTDTYKVGVNWALNDNVRIRTSLQHAVRAPNIGELYASQSLQLFNWDVDPCSTSSPQYSFEECARTGVTNGQYGNIPDSPAGQYNELGGGSQELTPEKSDTISVGVVLTPTFIENFSVTFDFYDITIDDAIDTISSAEVVRLCAKDINPSMCNLIHRSSSNGDLWVGSNANSGYVEATNINTGSFSTRGLDIDSAYNLETSLGDIHFNLVATYLESLEYEAYAGAAPYDCAGQWNRDTCGQPAPKWRHIFTTTWNTPWDLDLTARWRYFGSADELSEADDLTTLDAVNYFDVVGNWQVLGNTKLQFGVNNLFDKDPQIVTDAPSGEGNGNTFPGVYDALGRYVYAGVTVTF
ncbi:TonB-dependent receptor [Shewanella baltica]|uniref:TonB-dependent receptor domain-containing protein n=1 Tax=Shewanella baltica TaxID=62322 RepID=UPI002871C0C4|nr:TonB-dependent receptor [Shewanella baltica]MDR9768229.1 TonB-dependent receptor [Shewanella baltica]